MNTINTETKFAYRHKPTGKWCHLREAYIVIPPHPSFETFELTLIDEFQPNGVIYNARNIIEEDLLRSTMNGEQYASLNFSEFELLEIEVQYKIKE